MRRLPRHRPRHLPAAPPWFYCFAGPVDVEKGIESPPPAAPGTPRDGPRTAGAAPAQISRDTQLGPPGQNLGRAGREEGSEAGGPGWGWDPLQHPQIHQSPLGFLGSAVLRDGSSSHPRPGASSAVPGLFPRRSQGTEPAPPASPGGPAGSGAPGDPGSLPAKSRARPGAF